MLHWYVQIYALVKLLRYITEIDFKELNFSSFDLFLRKSVLYLDDT